MDLLFQMNPRNQTRGIRLIPCSFTESIQAYMNAARQESWILENNGRKANHEIVLRYFVMLSIITIRENWKRLRANLKRTGITFAAVIELTEGCDGLPNNCVHYHFLIDSTLDRITLKEIMKAACMNSLQGEYGKDYDLVFPNAGITNWGVNKIRYFTKYNHPAKIHLFVKGLRLKKFYYSVDWFVEHDGAPTKRSAILKRLKDEYKNKKKQIQNTTDDSMRSQCIDSSTSRILEYGSVEMTTF